MHLTIIGVFLRKTRKLLSLWFLLHTTVKEKHIGRSRNEFLLDSILTVCVCVCLPDYCTFCVVWESLSKTSWVCHFFFSFLVEF